MGGGIGSPVHEMPDQEDMEESQFSQSQAIVSELEKEQNFDQRPSMNSQDQQSEHQLVSVDREVVQIMNSASENKHQPK